MHVDMSISHFLPASEDRKVADILRSLAESDLTSTLVLDVSNADEDAVLLTSRRLRDRLLALPTTRSVTSGVDDEKKAAIGDFIASYPSSAFLPKTADEFGNISIRSIVSKGTRSKLTELKSGSLIRAPSTKTDVAVTGAPLNPRISMVC